MCIFLDATVLYIAARRRRAKNFGPKLEDFGKGDIWDPRGGGGVYSEIWKWGPRNHENLEITPLWTDPHFYDISRKGIK